MAEKLTYDQLLEANKKLTEKNETLEKQIDEMQGSKLPNIKGFLLDVDDPFGSSVISSYRKAGGKSNQPDRLPFVLPEGEEATKAALANYIQRADGAGDKIRVAAARKVLGPVVKNKK